MATHLKSEPCSLERSLEVLSTIYQKHSGFDVMLLPQFAQEKFRESGCSCRKQPDVKPDCVGHPNNRVSRRYSTARAPQRTIEYPTPSLARVSARAPQIQINPLSMTVEAGDFCHKPARNSPASLFTLNGSGESLCSVGFDQ